MSSLSSVSLYQLVFKRIFYETEFWNLLQWLLGNKSLPIFWSEQKSNFGKPKNEQIVGEVQLVLIFLLQFYYIFSKYVYKIFQNHWESFFSISINWLKGLWFHNSWQLCIIRTACSKNDFEIFDAEIFRNNFYLSI